MNEWFVFTFDELNGCKSMRFTNKQDAVNYAAPIESEWVAVLTGDQLVSAMKNLLDCSSFNAGKEIMRRLNA